MTGQPVETMTPPRPEDVRLDGRLLSCERLCRLAGGRALKFTIVHGGGVFLDCVECGRGVSRLAAPDHLVATTPMQIMSDTLRHYVSTHGVSLSGSGNDEH